MKAKGVVFQKLTIGAVVLSASVLTVILSCSQSSSTHLSEQRLENLARTITVRVFSTGSSGSAGGSGVLIRREGQQYIVLTNQHVVANKDRRYRVQTSDGRSYSAQILTSLTSEDDVGFLAFRSSSKTYRVLSLKAPSKLAAGESVFAGGFPYQDDLSQSRQFSFTRGQISLILDRPFVGGYQIGYTNPVRRGMSGGPLLNRRGELIGINGMVQYPLFGNPYVFKDGSTISEAEWSKMSELSWAVPVKYILKIL